MMPRNESNSKSKTAKIMISIAWILAVLVCVKSIFTDFGADNAYQVAMSYRHLAGDRMFLQMWEPHQMSILVNDLLMAIYHLIVPSYSGVVIFLQICGTLMFAGAGYVIYRTVKNVTGRYIAHLMWIFFVIFRAKQTPFPEFANYEILFSALAFCALVKYLRMRRAAEFATGADEVIYEHENGTKQKPTSVLLLVLIAALIFLQTISYPTCLLSAIAVIVLLCVGKTPLKIKLRDCFIFAGSLGVMGSVFADYFVFSIGFDNLLKIFKNIFNSDTHSTMKFGSYWTGFVYAMIGLAVCLIISALIHFVIGRIPIGKTSNSISGPEACKTTGRNRIGKVSFPTTCACVALAMEVVLILLQRKTGIDWNCSFFIIPTVMILMGSFVYMKMGENERMLWMTGVCMSAASFAATLILTDLGIITIIAYLVLGGVVSFIPLKYICKDHKVVAYLIVLLVLFHRGMVVWGYGNTNSRVMLVTESQNIIRSGPAAGIVCDHVTRNQAKMNEIDFRNNINADDKLFIVGGELIDPIDFVLAGCEVANYSTIDTPQYNESLEEYLKINPEKKPTVIAVSCWYGQLMVPEDSCIMQWVEENYTPVADGDYYRFYR